MTDQNPTPQWYAPADVAPGPAGPSGPPLGAGDDHSPGAQARPSPG